MGQDVKNQWGLRSHRQGGTKIAASYHAIKMDDDLHAQSATISSQTTVDAIIEASKVSEAAWLDEMPTLVKNWMNGRPSAERADHRKADQDIHDEWTDHGWNP
jgi:hypothetical protein